MLLVVCNPAKKIYINPRGPIDKVTLPSFCPPLVLMDVTQRQPVAAGGDGDLQGSVLRQRTLWLSLQLLFILRPQEGLMH